MFRSLGHSRGGLDLGVSSSAVDFRCKQDIVTLVVYHQPSSNRLASPRDSAFSGSVMGEGMHLASCMIRSLKENPAS